MESGTGGVPETGTPLERMPSSAESESAFSTTTEAESEMTDAADYEEGQSITPRQTYFLSYATDCLSAYDLVKKRSLAGIRALDDVSGNPRCNSFGRVYCNEVAPRELMGLQEAKAQRACSELSRARLSGTLPAQVQSSLLLPGVACAPASLPRSPLQ